MSTFLVVDYQDQGTVHTTEVIVKHQMEGWELVTMCSLPASYGHLTPPIRYVFKRGR